MEKQLGIQVARAGVCETRYLSERIGGTRKWKGRKNKEIVGEAGGRVGYE